MNHATLQHVGTFRDLGVIIDGTLSFTPHIYMMISKAYRTCGIIKRAIGFNAPAKVKLQLFKSLCMSILDYCSSVWSPHSKVFSKKIEHINDP
jgi:hypothetical protein